MSPAQFVTDVLVNRASSRIVSVGEDFRFGHDRVGDVAELRRQGQRHGFEVAAVELVADESGVISSSRIRDLIARGDVTGAAALLGRPHQVRGEVLHGEARGRRLGYPTANLATSGRIALPADGIYAVRVAEPVSAAAVASIGVRPTFGTGGARLLEVHLFDFEDDLYGSMLTVDFIARLRGEESFDSTEALIEQMERDSENARAILAADMA